MLTNKPACGAMRGHGTVNVRFAFESQLDELAAKINLDPAEIRRRNLLQPPCITVNGLRVQSYGLPECIEKTVERSGWKDRKGKLGKGRGLGIACSHYVSGAANSIIRSDMPHSTVNIKIDRDGGVVVYTGASEIGQGSDTMTAQIAAETLGCSARTDQDRRGGHRPYSYRHRLLFQPGDVYGGQCDIAGCGRSEEADCFGGGAEDGLCAAEELVFRDDAVFRKSVAGESPATTQDWRSVDTADGFGQRARGRADSCADRCSRSARTKVRKIR